MSDSEFYDTISSFIEIASEPSRHLKYDTFDEIIKIMLNYYSKHDFRHKYSQISRVIHNIVNPKNPTKDNSHILESINNNCDLLFMYFKDNFSGEYEEQPEILIRFNKLIDHITLEIVRLQYISQYNDLLVNNTELFNEASEKLRNAQNAIEIANERTKNMYAQIISILGIFASIIIAFFGGFNYFTSVLNNIKCIPKFRLLSISSIIGFVVMNTIFGMLYFIAKLIDKDISAHCIYDVSDEGCNNGCDKERKCCSISKLRKRLPYIFWVNVVLLLIIVLSTFCFIFYEI